MKISIDTTAFGPPGELHKLQPGWDECKNAYTVCLFFKEFMGDIVDMVEVVKVSFRGWEGHMCTVLPRPVVVFKVVLVDKDGSFTNKFDIESTYKGSLITTSEVSIARELEKTVRGAISKYATGLSEQAARLRERIQQLNAAAR